VWTGLDQAIAAMRRWEARISQSAAARAVAVLVVILLVVGAVGVILDLSGLSNGGESDANAHGSIIYEGQTTNDYSSRLLVVVGHGRGTVPVKAKQDWDKPGGLFSADLQPTNGTAFVQDPEDGSRPAKLQVDVTYCAQGTTTVRAGGTASDQMPEEIEKIEFDLGALVVCDADLLNSEYNNAAFVQDDTPAEFQGEFETQVRSAAITVTKAAPCPTKQLAKYRTKQFADKVRRTIALNNHVPLKDVTVTSPDIGRSDAATRKLLDRRLDALADPESSGPALDIIYLGTAASAVEDSCFVGFGSQPIERLSSMKVRSRG